MPITKTIGNSSPLALWMVMSVTSARSTSSASWSEKSEISWRNASSDASSWPRSSYSRATPTSSWRFSTRPCDSKVRSASSISM